MEKFRFLNWKVYKDAKELFRIILEIVKNLPNELRYTIGGQLTRSAFSIILNISEGSEVISNEKYSMIFAKIDGISAQLGGFKKL
jgi:four helix bundle protein